jgi:putative addiction module component (TIGR02574 family)
MPKSLHVIAQEALELPPEEREVLVERLIASLEPAQLHPDWEAEIGRRVDRLQRGEGTLVEFDDAMAQLAAHVHARRSAA